MISKLDMWREALEARRSRIGKRNGNLFNRNTGRNEVIISLMVRKDPRLFIFITCLITYHDIEKHAAYRSTTGMFNYISAYGVLCDYRNRLMISAWKYALSSYFNQDSI